MQKFPFSVILTGISCGFRLRHLWHWETAIGSFFILLETCWTLEWWNIVSRPKYVSLPELDIKYCYQNRCVRAESPEVNTYPLCQASITGLAQGDILERKETVIKQIKTECRRRGVSFNLRQTHKEPFRNLVAVCKNDECLLLKQSCSLRLWPLIDKKTVDSSLLP